MSEIRLLSHTCSFFADVLCVCVLQLGLFFDG